MKPVPVRFFFRANEVEETRSRRRFGQRSRFLVGQKTKLALPWVCFCLSSKKHHAERASVRRFPFRAEKPKPGRFLFSQSEENERRFFRSRLERFRRAGAVSRFAKRRNRRGKRVECRKARNGSFRTDTRCEGGCGSDGRRATLPSVARAGRVRAVRARAGLDRTPGVPSTSIVANVSRSSCVAVSERRACAVFDRSVRRDPEASFTRALAIFCALKCAMNARGGACERGGAITVGREATIAADWTRRRETPPARTRDSESGGGRARGAHQVFSRRSLFGEPPWIRESRKTVLRVRQNVGREVEKIWKSAARRQKREK